jgi:two-component system, NarL family, nitrate/nitrite response regulator NarL
MRQTEFSVRRSSNGPAKVPQRTQIYVVSNVRIFREALKSALEINGDVVIVGAGALNEATFLAIVSTAAQLILVDVASLGNLVSAKLIAELPTHPKVIAVGTGDSDEQVLACAEAGISGCVACDASISDLRRVMHEAIHDQFVCSPLVTAALVRKIAQLTMTPVYVSSALTIHLTSRQRQIASLLGEGADKSASTS